jgi:hypothetical protein
MRKSAVTLSARSGRSGIRIARGGTMTLAYGYVKAKIVSGPTLKSSRHSHETQYHLHFGMTVDGDEWDVAVNVGTNDADDQLKYKLVFDFTTR